MVRRCGWNPSPSGRPPIDMATDAQIAGVAGPLGIAVNNRPPAVSGPIASRSLHVWLSDARSGAVCDVHRRLGLRPRTGQPIMAPVKSLGAGTPTTEIKVFLSSAQDALDLRERVQGLVSEAINPALERAGEPQRLFVRKWQHAEPRRFGDGESIDDEFVANAVDSDLVLALAVERLGPGTQKEIDAVVASKKTELSLLWFVDPRDAPGRNPAAEDLESYIANLERDSVLRYKRAGRQDSNSSWEAIVNVLMAVVLKSMKPREERFREKR